MGEEELALSKKHKIEMTFVVLFSYSLLMYSFCQNSTQMALVSTILRNANFVKLIIFEFIAGFIGGAITFAFNWGVGKLLLKLITPETEQPALYLGLVVATTTTNLVMASIVAYLGTFMRYQLVASLLELGLFGIVYYCLSKQALKKTLILLAGYFCLNLVLSIIFWYCLPLY